MLASFKKGTNVIPIGLHWDLSLKIENSQIVKEYTKIKIYDGLFEKNKYNNQKKLEVDITKINHYIEDENNSEENTIIITDSKIDDINDNEIEVINDEFPKLGNQSNVSPTNMLWSKVAETRVKTPDDISSVYSYDQHINISETNSMRNADSNDNFNDMLKKFNILDTHDSNIISRKNSTDTMSEVIYSGYDKKINDLKKENNLLIGENRVQKEHIKNLRAVLSYDRNNDNEDEFKSKEINKLKEENEKISSRNH